MASGVFRKFLLYIDNLVAGRGFEPLSLTVISLTSYRAAPPALVFVSGPPDHARGWLAPPNVPGFDPGPRLLHPRWRLCLGPRITRGWLAPVMSLTSPDLIRGSRLLHPALVLVGLGPGSSPGGGSRGYEPDVPGT